jgi:hypothetical protein
MKWSEEFENRMLKRVYGPRGVERIGGSRKLHNEVLHNLYSSPTIIRMMRSTKVRWTGHVVRVARRGMHVGFS